MSMLPCRVLCLLAIVLCCVGVAHAAAGPSTGMNKYVEDARELAEETKKLKVECEKAGTTARQAADEAQLFVFSTKDQIKTIAADPEKVNKTKIQCHELIDKAMKAAAEARIVGSKTTDSLTKTETAASIGLPPEDAKAAMEAAGEADKAVRVAGEYADDAVGAAQRVGNILKELDAEVAAAEKKEKQKQHYRSTFTLNIHGDNLDALLNGAANNSSMALNDGSSSPALLRVPLLLLLLSVLGCMTLC
ncbi:uncharacterized protein TM35_000081470 [Trypanosoma theileri]|uniref:Surface protein TolT n=1 Tax=Trypanosoma theileri TaxID=67003 RepID=A0A1X0P1F5_9TRYP|nr:uncharacterized protein TM35_000081470 [Trypanosoma theileri]ORC90349.1 hypothetical protein TM35_000081470 [Trypanosoma theileri]